MFKVLLQAFRSFRFRSLFFRILGMLLFLCIVPVIMIGLSNNWYSQKIIREEVEQSSVQMLEQTRRLMDVLLNEIDEISIRMAQKEAFDTLLTSGSVEGLQNELEDMQSDLLDTYINYPYVESIYLYFANEQMILTPLQGLVPLSRFDDTGWLRHYESMNKHEGKWFVRVTGNAEQAAAAGAGPKVTFIRTVPYQGGQIQGAVVINMNQPALFQSPSLRLMREGEEIWMVSPDGQYAFSNKTGYSVGREEFSSIRGRFDADHGSFLQLFRGKDYVFTYVESPYTEWKYVDVIPADSMYSRIKSIQSFMMIVAVISAVLAAPLSFFAAFKIYAPIYSVMEWIANKNLNGSGKYLRNNRNEIGYLFSNMIHISKVASEMEQKMREHLPLLRQSVLQKLIKERPENEEETARQLADLQLKVFSGGFIVFVLRIDGMREFALKYNTQDQNLIRYFICKLAEEVMQEEGMQAFSVYTHERDQIIIGNFKQDTQREDYERLAIAMANKISHLLKAYLNISIIIGIGRCKNSLGEICDSYNEAQSALDIQAYRGIQTVVPIWSVQLDRPAFIQIYEKFRETKQIILARLDTDKWESIERELEQLCAFVKSVKGVPFHMVQHVFFQLVLDVQLRAAMIGQEPEMDMDRLHEEFLKLDSVDAMGLAAWEAIKNTRLRLKENNRNYKSPVIKQILDYIAQNYDKEISLSGIADQLNLDPSHVSRLFRQEVHVNFMEYLISVRLSRAKELLLSDRTASIKEIGSKVGYVNPRSFNRIFKKYEGVTPGEYREIHGGQALDMNKVY